MPAGTNPKGVKESQAPARGMPGYEGYLNERVVTLPEILQDAGYLTLCSGKWHLGLRRDKSPCARGFERSFALLPGSSNHFGWEPQLEEDVVEAPRPFSHVYSLHMEDGEYVRELPDDFYSSNSYGDCMLRYLKDWNQSNSNARSVAGAKRPFFAYLPFSAPHWPLQAPQEYIQHYRGMYDDGPDALRLYRLSKLKELGLVCADAEAHPVHAPEAPEWAQLSPEHQAKSARAMEVYAGMVECMDYNVGRVCEYLKEVGEFDNTCILFLSDNGAEGGAHEANPAFQGGPMRHLQKYYDNSLENLGNRTSFVWYGPRWAQASTAPSRLYKSFTTEGGIRVPLVAKFPAGYQSLPVNRITHQFSTVMDIAPTFLDMAGVAHPAMSYKGREVVSMRGKSMVPWLLGNSESIHGDQFVEGWEMSGRAAVRKGNWKAIYLPSTSDGPSAKGSDRWELYDLDHDQGEIRDLSTERPDILRDMLRLWDQYVVETGVVPLNPALGDFIAATEEQMPNDGWMEYEYWRKGAKANPEEFFRTPRRFDRAGHRIV